jgi:peptidoglycan/xylan/chitin deacetylase (PgdA/CDA1 family)
MLAGRGIDEAVFCDDLYMNAESLKLLSGRGHLVGAHGHIHMPFARMSPDGLEADIRTNIGVLADIVGERPAWVSYPYGRDGALPGDTVSFCAEFGFRVGVTIRPGWNREGVAASSSLRFNTNEVPAALEDIESAGAA